MLSVVTAKNGDRLIAANNVPLSSRYNPSEEARRYVRKTIGDSQPTLICIVGETAGHLTRAAAKLFPEASVYTIYLSRDLRAYIDTQIHPYFGDDPEDIVKVRNVINEYNVDGVAVVSWSPSLKIWDDCGEHALEAIRTAVRIASGNLMTTVGFGRRWLTNSVRNVIDLPDSITCVETMKPVFIAASGPSLESVLDDGSVPFDDMDVWALPSSVAALAHRGIAPKLIISTDPGAYAGMHYRGFRRFENAVVAYPLTARTGIAAVAASTLLIDQSGPFDHDIYSRLDLTGHCVPSNGTVAGTALDLALTQNVPILLSGLDFASANSIEHARPHAFHDMRLGRSNRCEPVHTQQVITSYDRYPEKLSRGFRTNSPLSTYADWFSLRIASLQNSHRIYRIAPSPVHITGCKPLDARDIKAIVQSAASQRASDGDMKCHPISSGKLSDRIEAMKALLENNQSKLEVRMNQFAGSGEAAFTPATDETDRLVYLLATRKYIEYRKTDTMDRRKQRIRYDEMFSDAHHFISTQIARIGSHI